MAPRSGDEFDDDVSIPSEIRVLRRIPRGRTAPRGDGSIRPSSDCFTNDPHDGSGMSVDIWDGTTDPMESLKGHDGFGLVSLSVAEIRKLGLGICREPLPGNPRHAVIQGKKTDSRKNKLARASEWVAEPAQK